MKATLISKILFVLISSLVIGFFLMNEVLPGAPLDTKYFLRLGFVTMAMILMEMFIFALVWFGAKFVRIAIDVKKEKSQTHLDVKA